MKKDINIRCRCGCQVIFVGGAESVTRAKWCEQHASSDEASRAKVTEEAKDMRKRFLDWKPSGMTNSQGLR